jgi:hypothetical protein
MHFKNYITLLFSTFLLLGCSYFFDQQKNENDVSYNEKTGSCISQVNNTMGRYFDPDYSGVIPDEELDLITDCYQTSMNAITKYTKSGRADSNHYIAENFELLFKNMHKDVNISLSELQSYIHLKYFLIGGREDSVSKKELKILSDILPTIVNLLKEMQPHRSVIFKMNVLTRDQQGYEKFNMIYAALTLKVEKLLKEFEPYQGNRKINVKDFGNFILSEFMNRDARAQEKYISLLVTFKNLVLNEQSEDLQVNDLSSFVMQTLLTYQSLSQFDYFVKDDIIFTSLGTIASFVIKISGQFKDSQVFKSKALDSLYDIISHIERVLTQAAKANDKQVIAFERLNDLFIKLEEAGLTNKTNLSAKTLGLFIEKLSSQWLEPEVKSNADFNINKIRYVKNLFIKWYDRQKTFNELFEDRQSINFNSLPSNFNNNSIILDWKKLLQRISIFHWDDFGLLLYNKDVSNLTYRELTVSNSIQTAVELFLRPFNSSSTPSFNLKVTADQAQEIYELLRVLGVEMGFMDSRIFDSGYRSFAEANNFSSIKKNDSVLDFYEGYEYLAIAMSSGSLAQSIYESIDPKYYLDYKDVHHQYVTDAQAFRDNFYQGFPEFFKHLKVINSYWQSASNKERQEFVNTLEIASRAGVISEKPYDLGEIRVTTTILYYLESIFNLFDTDHNNIATGQELRRAEKHFRPLIVKFILDSQKETLENKKTYLSKQMKVENPTNAQMAEWLAPKVFIYLLKYREIPKGFSFSFWWLMSQSEEDKQYAAVEANTQDVMSVFSTLAKINHETHIKSIKAFLTKQHGYYKEGKLIQELNNQNASECSGSNKNDFCKWSRLIYCSENMDQYLFDWMTNNRYNLFPEELWKMNAEYGIRQAEYVSKKTKVKDKNIRSPEELKNEVDMAVDSTMEIFEKTFRSHKLFSTLCAFPQLDKE